MANNERKREEKIKKNPMAEKDVKNNPQKGKQRDPYAAPTASGGQKPTKPKSGDKR